MVEKTTVERKLLSSLLYDLAKAFTSSTIAGTASINVDRKLAFEALWAFLPNFHPYENQSCVFKKEPKPFKIMCSNIFSGFVSDSNHRMKDCDQLGPNFFEAEPKGGSVVGDLGCFLHGRKDDGGTEAFE